MKKLLASTVMVVGSFLVLPAASAVASPPCSYGGAFGAQILKGPVSAGEHVQIDAEVQTQGANHPTCSITGIQSVATFADGTTKTLATHGRVSGGGVTGYFTKKIVVQPSYLTVENGQEVFRINVTTTGKVDGSTITGTASYAVGANG